MAKKKELPEFVESEIKLPESEAVLEVPPAPEPIVVKELTEAQLNKGVRVQNQGELFAYDLTAYGYGMRFPKMAIYFLPTRVYLDMLAKGLKGREV